MTARITSNGRVTIPRAIREAAGLWPGTKVSLELDGDAVRSSRLIRAARVGAEPSWSNTCDARAVNST
jgi:AbrB family looped-hinge helix DNA binding protein